MSFYCVLLAVSSYGLLSVLLAITPSLLFWSIFINRKRITYMNKRLMAEASRFQSSQERKRFWLLILGTLAAALTGFFIFNFL
ncbi:hypothetical protein C4Y62_011925 [Klebsiella pneumoniae subsp. pneumoniae]|nr:hypothetical protein C4Y62_011925 [Klebsiella pneumoniae subsp. pneumoniae]